MGPLLSRLSETLELAPLAQPGLLHQLDESYFERVGAIDFAVRHDDGRNPDDLAREPAWKDFRCPFSREVIVCLLLQAKEWR